MAHWIPSDPANAAPDGPGLGPLVGAVVLRARDDPVLEDGVESKETKIAVERASAPPRSPPQNAAVSATLESCPFGFV